MRRLGVAEIDAVYVSATPETTHYPITRDCLAAGKHVFLDLSAERNEPVTLPLPGSKTVRAVA